MLSQSRLARAAPASPAAGRVAIVRLQLAAFRTYAALSLALDDRHVVLVGENGAGKTNLLEAVSLLTPGRGLRRATYDAMTRRGEAGPWSIAAAISKAPEGETVRIGTGPVAAAEGERARRVRIDGEPAENVASLLDHLTVLWLTPAMDGLFVGAASERRRFLDRLVLPLDPAHGARVAGFERTMRGRNRLLEEGSRDVAWLTAIEAQMAELAVAIAAARLDCVGHLARHAGADAPGRGAFPHAEIALEGALEAALAAGAKAAAVEEDYRAVLAAGRSRDAGAGRTLDGPHRSDLIVTHGPKGVAAADASTGEQKALLLGLVLSQAALIAEISGHTPILLLDEVAAHLDERRRAALFDTLDALGAQAWLTGTEQAAFAPLGARAQIVAVSDGRAVPVGD